MKIDPNTPNPFASPPSIGETVAVVAGRYEIQGDRIVGKDKIILPHACVKCGEKLPEQDSSTRRKKDLYWVHPAVFVLVVVQMLVFILVYLITRKKCRVEYSICRDCNARKRINIVYCVVSLLFFIGMIMLMINLENGWFALGVIFGFVAIITFAIRANGPLAVKAYKSEEFQLRGAGLAFLQYAESYTEAQVIPAVVVAEDGRLV